MTVKFMFNRSFCHNNFTKQDKKAVSYFIFANGTRFEKEEGNKQNFNIMTLIKFQNPGFRRMVDAAWTPSPLNHLMDTFLGSDVIGRSNLPAVNVIESPEMFRMEFSVPGFKKEELSVSLEDNVLTVKGTHNTEKNETQEKYTRKEFSKVSFTRSFSLPEGIETDQLEAKFEDGLLLLNLPKKAEIQKESIKTVNIQ